MQICSKLEDEPLTELQNARLDRLTSFIGSVLGSCDLDFEPRWKGLSEFWDLNPRS